MVIRRILTALGFRTLRIEFPYFNTPYFTLESIVRLAGGLGRLAVPCPRREPPPLLPGRLRQSHDGSGHFGARVMTGICGIFNRSGQPVDPARATAMGERLLHRCIRGTVQLATPAPHVALVRIGPSEPPGPRNTVLDGDIYNVSELESFTGETGNDPAAQVSRLYELYGLAGLTRLDGDLALACYDPVKDRLALWRDRFGITPLYYTQVGDDFLYASEIKAFSAYPEFDPLPDQAALFDYLATHYRYIHRIPARTFHRNVHQVPAAHVLEMNRSALSTHRYWDLELDRTVSRPGRG